MKQAIINTVLLAAVSASLLVSLPAGAECRAGSYTIIDGNTLEYEGTRIELQGVADLEGDQHYAKASMLALQQLIALNCPVQCIRSDENSGDSALSVCYGSDGISINSEMVRLGHAWADWTQSKPYLSQEQEAKAAAIGLWNDNDPVSPLKWREDRDKDKDKDKDS